MWFERLTANSEVVVVLGSILSHIPASFDTVESKERQMKQCWVKFFNTSCLAFMPIIYIPKVTEENMADVFSY